MNIFIALVICYYIGVIAKLCLCDGEFYKRKQDLLLDLIPFYFIVSSIIKSFKNLD